MVTVVCRTMTKKVIAFDRRTKKVITFSGKKVTVTAAGDVNLISDATDTQDNTVSFCL